MFIILIILQHDITACMGTVDRPLPPTHFWNPNTRRGSSVGSMSALYANSPNIEPRVRLSWIFPSYAYFSEKSKLSVTGQKNGH